MLCRNALRRHLEMDLPAVMETIRGSMNPSSMHGLGSQQDMVAEASAACRCAEAWIDYGLGAESVDWPNGTLELTNRSASSLSFYRVYTTSSLCRLRRQPSSKPSPKASSNLAKARRSSLSQLWPGPSVQDKLS